MKILMVSMNSIHFRRWSDQLRDSGHEVFWFDILDQGYAPSMSWMTQITGWKKGFLKRRGRTFLKRKLPKVYKRLEGRYDIPIGKAFEKNLLDIQPDVVHSFALQIGCLPILPVMNKYQNFKWVYSAWGTDLFRPELVGLSIQKVQSILQRIDFLITDNYRDFEISRKLGFENKFLGVYPGNGGTRFNHLSKSSSMRDGILIKANQDKAGEGDLIAKAIYNLRDKLSETSIYFIGASENCLYKKLAQLPFVEIFKRSEMLNTEALNSVYSKCFLYVAVSKSDGTPNMLIEALGNGLYSIQSNPGNALNELIVENISGNLISTTISQDDLEFYIIKAVENKSEIIKNMRLVSQRIRDFFEVSRWTSQIKKLYDDLK